jgi:hypothetical protein
MSDPARLAAFDACLAKNTDRRVKITAISKKDDFSEMPEGKFLEFCREAKIISSSIFTKLKGRLDERNAAAHPSGVSVKQKAAEVYVEDLGVLDEPSGCDQGCRAVGVRLDPDGRA